MMVRPSATSGERDNPVASFGDGDRLLRGDGRRNGSRVLDCAIKFPDERPQTGIGELAPGCARGEVPAGRSKAEPLRRNGWTIFAPRETVPGQATAKSWKLSSSIEPPSAVTRVMKRVGRPFMLSWMTSAAPSIGAVITHSPGAGRTHDHSSAASSTDGSSFCTIESGCGRISATTSSASSPCTAPAEQMSKVMRLSAPARGSQAAASLTLRWKAYWCVGHASRAVPRKALVDTPRFIRPFAATGFSISAWRPASATRSLSSACVGRGVQMWAALGAGRFQRPAKVRFGNRARP